MSETEPRDAGYDDLLDALAEGDGYYLACPSDHGSLPPRRVCPRCGAADLEERPLPETGEVASFTVVRVATPRFADDVPYVTAVADFGPVRLTGVVQGVDPDDVALGDRVAATVGSAETTGDRIVALRPA
ncbi:MAG: Zn-ribbon domain-containing OB-fold protein [Halobacteriales archaeon]